jgi:hypothetical protein
MIIIWPLHTVRNSVSFFFFTIIFAVFEETSINSSESFRVINAFKSRENRSLAEVGGMGVAI